MADKTNNNAEACELKPTDAPKPCCVCLKEKNERDECLLFNGLESDQCKPLIDQYKKCMEGYGFKI